MAFNQIVKRSVCPLGFVWPLEAPLKIMAAPKPFYEHPSPGIPGAVVEWQSGPGRIFRFAVGEDSLVVGSAPGADIRLGQKDPPLLAAFRLGLSKSGEEPRLHLRILAPHCPLIKNGNPAEIQTTLKTGDRIDLAGYVGKVLQILVAPIPPISERIGAPELAEYAKALESHAALVDQWHKSLEKRQEELEKREHELKRVLEEVILQREEGAAGNLPLIPDHANPDTSLVSPQFHEAQSHASFMDSNNDRETPTLIDSQASSNSNWHDDGGSWDFLGHPEAELVPASIETSPQYWPPAEETAATEESTSSIDSELPGEADSLTGPILTDPMMGDSETIRAISDLAISIPQAPLSTIVDDFDKSTEPVTPRAEETVEDLSIGDEPAGSLSGEEATEQNGFPPVGFLYPGPIEDPIGLGRALISNVSDPDNTNFPEITPSKPTDSIQDTPPSPVGNPQETVFESECSDALEPEMDCGSPSQPESWTVPLGEFLCSGELTVEGPIEAIHISGSPKVFVEAISTEEPAGGFPAWEHENLPRELGRLQSKDRDFRVWEIPQGPGLMELELPPVLGIWYRLVLQTVLGVRALHAAGRNLGGKSQKSGRDWAALEPSGLVKLYGPGTPGDDQAADLKRVGQLAQNLWTKAFGQAAPQPEFIKDLLGRLTGHPGCQTPMESLDQLAVELDRVGLRIRANPYAWAALLQKTFPGWTSPPSKRLSA